MMSFYLLSVKPMKYHDNKINTEKTKKAKSQTHFRLEISMFLQSIF